MSLNIAYLAQGKLYLKQGNKAIQEVESEFGQSIQERRLQIERRQSLRNRGIQSMMRGPQPIKGNEPPAEVAIPISITSICPDGQKQLLYALESADLGGLFTFDPTNNRENRLFHNTEFRISHLDYSSKQDLIACTKTYQTGVTNLATLSPDKVRPKDLTEGDSIDIAPRWVSHKEKAIVYQSAGVSRNQAGLVINRAPFSIMQIDFEKEDVTTLAEDPKSDLMGPGQKALGKYLGQAPSSWQAYDATQLIQHHADANRIILIDQGTDDTFLGQKQLLPEVFDAACKASGQPLELRMQNGYDHGYYFISTFMEDHIRHHAKYLLR